VFYKLDLLKGKNMFFRFGDMKLSSLAFVLFTPILLYLHPQIGSSSGFMTGFAHPLNGLDHMIAMFAVGLWAVQVGGKGIWLIPLAFVCMMIAGGILGMSGVTVPFVETGIIMSVLILGVLLVASARLPIAAGMVLMGIFALFHGHSHGTEIPATVSGLAFSAGFALSTVMLHSAGIAAGLTLRKASKMKVLRYAGAAIIASGIMMIFL